MKTKNIIRFSTEDFKAIKDHLASAGRNESFIYALFSKAQNKECSIYICSRLIIPDQIHLQDQSRISIEPSREYQAINYGLAYELGKSIIDIHTHPFSSNAKFSSIDDFHGTENAKYITNNFSDSSTMGMVVLGNGFDNFEARIWNRKRMRFEPVNRIEVLGCPSTILTNPRCNLKNDSNEIYARHNIIPGWKQGLIEDLKVFVCGLGGNGALVFDSLLSLGVGKRNGWIKACDPDILEKSNLPRLPYAYPYELGMSKAELAQTHAVCKAPELNINCIQAGIENEEVQQILKEANIIFGAVDNDGARVILNGHAARYIIPYIDLGTEIIPQKSGCEAIGQVQMFIPGKTGCLTCSGSIDPSQAALDSMSQEDDADYQRAGYIRGSNETPTPSVLHLNGVVSHLAISQLLKMLFDDNFDGKDFISYDRQTSRLIAASTVRDDDCPVCGIKGYIGNGDDQSSISGLEDLKDNAVFEKLQSTQKTGD